MFGWFKKKKQKDLINENVDTRVKEEATKAVIEAIEVKQKPEIVTLKKPNHFADCNCFKCVRWRNQNAK
jgi:hypothetical protein